MTETTTRISPPSPPHGYWGPPRRADAELVWQLMGPKSPIAPGAPAPAEQEPVRNRRRELLVTGSLAALAAGVVAALALAPNGQPVSDGSVTITALGSHRIVQVASGRLDMAKLISRLSAGDLSRRADGSYDLHSDLVVARGGRLDLTGVRLHLLSTATTTARLRVVGGRLTLSHSFLDTSGTGTVGDVDAAGPTARLDIEHSTLSGLGTGADQPGITWRGGASGSVTDTHVLGGFRGLYGYRNGPISIASTTVTGQRESGVVLRSPAAAVVVRGSTVSGAGSDGISLIDAMHPVRLLDDEVSGNRSDGVSLSSGHGVTVRGVTSHDNAGNGLAAAKADGLVLDRVLAYANGSGIVFHDVQATLTHNASSGNLHDGLLIDDPNSAVVIDHDRYDHNGRAGVWLADGRVALARSRMNENQTGLRMADSSPSVSATSDVFSDNVKDGVALGPLEGVGIRSSTFDGNLSAAFSLTSRTDLSALLRANTVLKDQTVQRVRAGGSD
ncbi:MAG: right-handed parallel beta-helix repeat-containing protein [Frankiales bacterium]|nr:right-handed parallel beta-helix repeat-containing protein [Frankiales bacterium]